MEIKIDQNIPVPSKRGDLVVPVSATLKKMKVGDSVLVDKSVANSFRAMAPRYGMVVTGRQQEDGNIRVWRLE